MLSAPDRVDGEAVSELLSRAGLGGSSWALEDCPGGGNNRVYALRTASARYALKWYFRHETDTRDRLSAEFEFLRYAYLVAPDRVPRPHAALPAEGLALYEFVEGRKLVPGEVSAGHLDQAIDLLLRLNGPDRLARGGLLGTASEGFFSIAGQLAAVRARVSRLETIAAQDAEGAAARAAATRIRTLLDAHSDRILQGAQDRGIDPAAELGAADRCLSPSDFGFHNALLRADGRLTFLDFEYAGWDDPAKTICDLFWQPAVPVPRTEFDRVVTRCAGIAADARSLEWRVRLLMPLFGIKWCCILLNEFLPDAARRRRFATHAPDAAARKRAQLDKVHRFIDMLPD